MRGTDPGPGAIDPPRDLGAESRARLRDREEGALAEFYEAYFDRIYGYVRRLLGEDHIAEDVTQDIFMQIYQSLSSYDPARALRPWVFTIATNKVRDFWRSKRFGDSRRETGIDDDEGHTQVASRARGPAEELANEELGVALARAIDDLPEGMRTVLVLRYFEGLSFEAIGAIVDRNEAAVRKRYSRALEELRRVLGKALDPSRGGAG